MKRLIKIWAATLFIILGNASIASADAQAPPCTESTCATNCGQIVTNLGMPSGQPAKPPETGFARCLTVGVQEGGDDGCDYVDHVVCDCDGSPPQPGVAEIHSGMPLFGMKADAPDDACVRPGELPDSCLMRGSDVRCKVDGDGSDCKAACDLLRTRIDAELPRSQTVTLDGSQCASAQVCSCVIEFEGKCFALNTYGYTNVACGTSPKQAWDDWYENMVPPKHCGGGNCSCNLVSPSPWPLTASLSFGSLIALAILRRKRRQ